MSGGSTRVLVIHGPNLNLLGTREPDVYGTDTLDNINASLTDLASDLGASVDCRQSNHEGEIVDWLHEAGRDFDAVLINPAAFTHTSVALRDAISAIAVPAVEVHLSNIHAREDFRKESLISPVAIGVIGGFGSTSYTLGLRALVDRLKSRGG